MFLFNVAKELKIFFRSKGDVLFVLLFPIILITLMSYAMQSMIGGSSNLEMEGTRILYVDESSEGSENMKKFEVFAEKTENGSIKVDEIQPEDIAQGKREVINQDACALITITDDGFDYYRSPYNEPYIGQVIREYFKSFINIDNIDYVQHYVTVEEKDIDSLNSTTYYTLVDLSFMIIYIAMIIGKSVFLEKELQTDSRIKLSGTSMVSVILSKVTVGVIIGLVQIFIVYVFSRFILRMDWGRYTLLMFFIYVVLTITVSSLGALIGLLVNNKVMVSNIVLTLAIMSGLFGGMFTPISYLEASKVIAIIMKCTPLYWVNKSILALQQGIVSTTFWGAIIVCSVLSVIFVASSTVLAKRSKVRET